MKKRSVFRWRWPLAAGAMLVSSASAGAAGFETLSEIGNNVMTTCNPDDSVVMHKCRVDSLPGESGFNLVASRSSPLVRNEVVIGTVHEKVWRRGTDTTQYIFGVRLTLNAEASDANGTPYNVNDLFRQTLPKRNVSVAYFQSDATKALREAGRTVQGLNEFEEAQPERNNAWVRFHIDVNAAEAEGPSSASSPWLLTKTRAREGFTVAALGLRLLNSDFEEPEIDATDLFTSAYQPNGVPPPEEEEEEEEEPAP